MMAFKLAERSLGLVSTVVLARLLVPADFGIVAMAMSVIALIELASALSFEIALIQKEQPTRDDYDTAWTLNVMLGSGCGLLTAALAYPASLFYSEPRLTLVMPALAVALLIQSFENIGVVDFRRKMDFSSEFKFLASKKFAGFLVTVSLAVLIHDYWALVAGAVAGRVVGVISSYWMQPFRPHLRLAARQDLFSFSAWLLVNNTIGFGTARLSHFVVGRLYGSSALGVYTLGSEIAMLPSTELAAPINRAVFPGYARMVGDSGALTKGFLDVLAVTAVVALPASFGIAAIADPMVRVVLGDRWLQAIAPVQILAFCGAVHVLLSNSYSAYLALGRARVLALLGGIRLAALIALLATLSSIGVVAVALAEVGAALALFIASQAILLKTFDVSIRTYFANLWRPLIAAGAMGLIVAAALRELAAGPHPARPELQLVIGVMLGVGVYGAGLTILWLICGRPRGPEVMIMNWLAEASTVVLRGARRSNLRK